MWLSLIGGMALMAVLIVELNIFIGALAIAPRTRLIVTFLIGLWVGLQISLAATGLLANGLGPQNPLVGPMLALPLVVVAAAAGFSEPVRRALLGVPAQTLVGLNVSRVEGVLFLLLAAEGTLGGPFPISAGWGDIITGLAALPLAAGLARGTANRTLMALWNTFGTLDLVVAAFLVAVSFNGTPTQIFHAGAGANAIATLPWSLIPTVLVPFYLITHAVIFAQLAVPVRALREAPQ